MKLKDKIRGNLLYNHEFHLLLGNKKDFKIYIDEFNDVILSYGERKERTISENKEDIEFYKELLK